MEEMNEWLTMEEMNEWLKLREEEEIENEKDRRK
jgi:hypothetical protein